jgi:hypothetical protein
MFYGIQRGNNGHPVLAANDDYLFCLDEESICLLLELIQTRLMFGHFRRAGSPITP